MAEASGDPREIDAGLAAEIDRLPRAADRPLLIVDADEVLFLFLAGLEGLMTREGLFLDLAGFRLTGSIKRRADGAALTQAEVSALIKRFFASEMHTLVPVSGAARALEALTPLAQIIVLTNTPAESLDARRHALARHGMTYPVLANVGLKGPAVARLVRGLRAPAAFIDDLPPNHESVAALAPDVLRIQMVADPRLAEVAPPSPHAHHRADAWPAAAALLRAHFGTARPPFGAAGP